MKNLYLLSYLMIMLLGLNVCSGQNLEIPASIILFKDGNKCFYLDWEKNHYILKSDKAVKNFAQAFFLESEYFSLNEQDDFKIINSLEDKYTLQHFHKGIKVEGSTYYINLQNQSIKALHGSILENCAIDTNKILSKSVLLNKLRKDQSLASKLRRIIRRVDFQSIELVFSRIKPGKNELRLQDYQLSYKVTLKHKSFQDKYIYYFDAFTAKQLKALDQFDSGTVKTLYNGTHSFKTKWTGSLPWRRYILKDEQRNIHTYHNGNNRRDYDDKWTNNGDRPSATAHWALQMTWDYFNTTFGRDGLDNNGSEVTANARDSDHTDNALWDRNNELLIFGIPDKIMDNDPVSLDVVGHEYAHGISYYILGNGFTQDPAFPEAQALNESFSDIFGTMIEFHVEGTAADWVYGEDYISDNSYLRSLSNPNSIGGYGITSGGPSSYEQPGFWDFNGSRHINCSVQNHWFFLLSEGGSLNGINVNGIGKHNAIKIVYGNLLNFITPTSDYNNARNGSILAAIDEFGLCSNELFQTINAWNAVNVNGTPFNVLTINNCNALSPGNNSIEAMNGLISTCNISSHNFFISFGSTNFVELQPGFISNQSFEASICNQ